MKDLFRGELVRLAAEEPELRARQEARWQRDSEFQRLGSAGAPEMVSVKKLQQLIEKTIEDGSRPQSYFFSIRVLDEDKPIGFLSLWMELIHSDAWVGISIGEREYWGKGCGTDALKLCLQYAFTELGVQRVSLGVYEYNLRAIHAYEKTGFHLEGRTRQDLMREGQRFDTFWMGILREEWLQIQNGEKP